MKTDILITVASWEDRFLLGTQRLISEGTFSRALIFYYAEYDARTKTNREQARAILSSKGIKSTEEQVSFGDPVSTWSRLHDHISHLDPGGSAVVDISTMPRDTLWSMLLLLQERQITINYVYHRPQSYHSTWLSRDPGRPRLVYKLSGVATLGRPTCLIITTGFDPERTRQLMWYYEPRRILIGFQTGPQFENIRKNADSHRQALSEEYREFDVEEFELDAYSQDHGAAVLTTLVERWSSTHNIIMTSLGPKLGAISMFRVHAAFSETALAYTPSGDFNSEYSTGIGDSCYGELLV